MSHRRRDVLRAAGTLGAAAAYPIGTVAANCEEAVDEYSFSGGPLQGAAGPAGFDEESTAPFSTDAFADADADLEGRRMDVRIETDGLAVQSPVLYDWVEVDVEHRRDGEWVVIGAWREDGGDGEFSVYDGESDFQADAEAVVVDGEEYRITVRAYEAPDTVFEWNVDVDFVAFDPDC